MSYYWIKLYHEILNDPKMGRLSDRTWRRAIELFLLAGETGDSGQLPEIEDIAWRLRVPVDELKEDIAALIEVGILAHGPDDFFGGMRALRVVNFAKRQGPIPDVERVAQSRKRQYRAGQANGDESGNESDETCNELVTSRDTDGNEPVTNRVEIRVDTEPEADTEQKQSQDAAIAACATAQKPPAAPVPSEPKGNGAASREMFSALAALCQYDLALITDAQRGQLNQCEKLLRKANITPTDLPAFGEWWTACDWRGKKGDPPKPSQVRETWGQYLAWKKNGGPKHAAYRPGDRIIEKPRADPVDPIQVERDRVILAEHAKKRQAQREAASV